MSAVAILGGAFDPPHVGHVALAEDAVEHFRLERLLVRVIEDPGHKEVDTAPQIRLLLAELAFAPLDEADVALDRYGRTVDSLAVEQSGSRRANEVAQGLPAAVGRDEAGRRDEPAGVHAATVRERIKLVC